MDVHINRKVSSLQGVVNYPCMPFPDNRPMPSFAERLTTARKSSGMSKSALARKSGVVRQLIQKYENGEIAEPSAVVALRLASALSVSVAWLVIGEGSRAPRLALAEDERDLVLTYRGLTPAFRETLLSTAHGLLTATRGPSAMNPYPPRKK